MNEAFSFTLHVKNWLVSDSFPTGNASRAEFSCSFFAHFALGLFCGLFQSLRSIFHSGEIILKNNS